MYNEKEIKRILQRAGELQKRSEGIQHTPGVNEKLTLEEVEAIARESGLSPEYVRLAALEYEGVPVEEPLFLDTSDDHKVEIIGFANGQLDPKTWAELRSTIEYHFNNPGKVKRRPDGIIWQADPRGISKLFDINKSPAVEVKSSGNKSTIHIRKSLKTYIKPYSIPAYTAFAGTFALIAIALQTGSIEPILLAALLAGISRLFFQLGKNKKVKEMNRLKDFMEQLQIIITRRFSVFDKKNTAQSDELIQLNEDYTEDESQVIKKHLQTK